MEIFFAAPAVLDWIFIFFARSGLGEPCYLCFPVTTSLLAMLDMTSLVDCKEDVFDLFERCNFNIMLGGEHVTKLTPMGKTFNFLPPGVLTSSDLPFYFPDKPITNLFFDGDFGCVFAMIRSIMKMICIVSKNDWLLTPHLTPSVIDYPSQNLSAAKKKNQVIPIPLYVTPNHFDFCPNFGDNARMSTLIWIYP